MEIIFGEDVQHPHNHTPTHTHTPALILYPRIMGTFDELELDLIFLLV